VHLHAPNGRAWGYVRYPLKLVTATQKVVAQTRWGGPFGATVSDFRPLPGPCHEPILAVMIEVNSLTKRYGEKLAVRDLSFRVQPGMVTGFLGPNGAGKSTTMRLILGLDAPDTGSTLIDSKPYREQHKPMHKVGALLDARSVHPGRTAYNHLLVLARTQGIPRSRVDTVIKLIGLEAVANKRAGQFSLGMSQRLGIASALLGDPEILILDEPINGLDPEGIHWIRDLLKELAAEGRTVFLSSHLMSEMAITAEHLIIIGRGRLIRDVSLQDFVDEFSPDLVHVRSPDAERLRAELVGPGRRVEAREPGLLEVHGMTSMQIGEAALAAGIALYELTPQQASLESAFIELTKDESEYGGTVPGLESDLDGADKPQSATTVEGSAA